MKVSKISENTIPMVVRIATPDAPIITQMTMLSTFAEQQIWVRLFLRKIKAGQGQRQRAEGAQIGRGFQKPTEIRGGFHCFGPYKPLIDTPACRAFALATKTLISPLVSAPELLAINSRSQFSMTSGANRPENRKTESRQYHASHNKGAVIAVQRMLFNVRLSGEMTHAASPEKK